MESLMFIGFMADHTAVVAQNNSAETTILWEEKYLN